MFVSYKILVRYQFIQLTIYSPHNLNSGKWSAFILALNWYWVWLSVGYPLRSNGTKPYFSLSLGWYCEQDIFCYTFQKNLRYIIGPKEPLKAIEVTPHMPWWNQHNDKERYNLGALFVRIYHLDHRFKNKHLPLNQRKSRNKNKEGEEGEDFITNTSTQSKMFYLSNTKWIEMNLAAHLSEICLWWILLLSNF